MTDLLTKKCKRCCETKPLNLFFKNKNNKDGHAYECKECVRMRINAARLAKPEHYKQQSKKWRENNPNYVQQWQARNRKRTKVHKRSTYLKSTYGISIDQYEDMRVAQQYRCYICNKHENEIPNAGPTALNVDHCHTTGSIRKLLCMSCNIALGKLNDDVNLLQRCIEYVKEHQ